MSRPGTLVNVPPYARTGTHNEAKEEISREPELRDTGSPYRTDPVRPRTTNGFTFSTRPIGPDDPFDPKSGRDHGGWGINSNEDNDPARNCAILFGTASQKQSCQQPTKSQFIPTYMSANDNKVSVEDYGGSPKFKGPSVRVYGNPNYWAQPMDGEKDEKDTTKARAGINYKIKWDQKAESFPSYERLINNHCQQQEIGYLLVPHFMSRYMKYGVSVFEKVPQYCKPGMSLKQFVRDNNALYEQQWSRNLEMLDPPTSKPRRLQNAMVKMAEMEEESSEDERIAAYGKQAPPRMDLRVSEAWWKLTSPEEQEVLKRLRTKAIARLDAKGESPKEKRVSTSGR